MFDIAIAFFVFGLSFLIICTLKRAFVLSTNDNIQESNSTENGGKDEKEQVITLTQTQLQSLIENKFIEFRKSLTNSAGSIGDKSENVNHVAASQSHSGNTIAHVAFKPPQPLYSQNPSVWFEILEQQFIVANIKAETTRYSHAVSALDSRLHNTFADLITRDKGELPYSVFKQEIIRVLGESEKTKLHNIMHGLSLEDMKPSQLLAKFKLNAGTLFNESAIRQMWLSRLPQQVQMVLTLFENDVPLATLAERADNVFETMTQTQINAVDKSSFGVTQPERTVPSSDIDVKLEKFRTKMLAEIKDLITSNSRSQSRSRSVSRSSRSNPSRSISQRREISPNGECFYHHRFGDKAHKCVNGCKYYSAVSGTINSEDSKN